MSGLTRQRKRPVRGGCARRSKGREDVAERDGSGLSIQIKGLKQTMAALKAFTPEVYRVLRKRIRTRLKSVASGAKGRYGGIYKVSIKDAGRNPGGSVFAVVGPKANKNDWSSPATKAVIGEFAAKGKTPQAEGFVRYMDIFGAPGRFLWEEWDSNPDIEKEIEADIRDAERRLQATLDAAGESY